MIKIYAEKETEKSFIRMVSRRLPQNIQLADRMKLEVLSSAEVLQDLRVPPGNRLEKLSGDRKGQYSIKEFDNR
jgi:proteic killer suppression protein